jgi:hypothetical protein
MLKYISFITIFIGICFFALLKNEKNYLDMILISFPTLFSYISVNYLVKNKFNLKKWHIAVGIIGMLYSILSIYTSIIIIWKINYRNELVFVSFINNFHLIFSLFIIFQFIFAIKKNRSLKKQQLLFISNA